MSSGAALQAQPEMLGEGAEELELTGRRGQQEAGRLGLGQVGRRAGGGPRALVWGWHPGQGPFSVVPCCADYSGPGDGATGGP